MKQRRLVEAMASFIIGQNCETSIAARRSQGQMQMKEKRGLSPPSACGEFLKLKITRYFSELILRISAGFRNLPTRPKLRLNPEEQHLLARAQANGYVTADRRYEFDTVADAYREWCRRERQPFLEIALDEVTSRVTLSLIEAGKRLPRAAEKRRRAQLAHYCLYDGEMVIEADFCIAERVENERLPALLAWLRRAVIEGFPAYL